MTSGRAGFHWTWDIGYDRLLHDSFRQGRTQNSTHKHTNTQVSGRAGIHHSRDIWYNDIYTTLSGRAGHRFQHTRFWHVSFRQSTQWPTNTIQAGQELCGDLFSEPMSHSHSLRLFLCSLFTTFPTTCCFSARSYSHFPIKFSFLQHYGIILECSNSIIMHDPSSASEWSSHTGTITTRPSVVEHLCGHPRHCSHTWQSCPCITLWPRKSTSVHFSQPWYTSAISCRWCQTEDQHVYLGTFTTWHSYQWFRDPVQSELGHTASMVPWASQVKLRHNLVWGPPPNRLTFTHSYYDVGNMHYIPMEVDSRSPSIVDSPPPRSQSCSRIVRLEDKKDHTFSFLHAPYGSGLSREP